MQMKITMLKPNGEFCTKKCNNFVIPMYKPQKCVFALAPIFLRISFCVNAYLVALTVLGIALLAGNAKIGAVDAAAIGKGNATGHNHHTQHPQEHSNDPTHANSNNNAKTNVAHKSSNNNNHDEHNANSNGGAHNNNNNNNIANKGDHSGNAVASPAAHTNDKSNNSNKPARSSAANDKSTCGKCTEANIKLTLGDGKTTASPKATHLEPENGCVRLSVACEATPQSEVFMQFNVDQGGPKQPIGQPIQAILVCGGDGTKFHYEPGAGLPSREITEVNCIIQI